VHASSFDVNGAPRKLLNLSALFLHPAGMRAEVREELVNGIDVGFSNEETGIVYLAFGHAF